MFTDSHIHIGQFYDIYTSPEELSSFLKSVGVDRYAVSSTTMCEENYAKVRGELSQLVELDGNKVFPVLWITPSLLKNDKELQKFLEIDFIWKCLKVHPQLAPKEWNPMGINFNRIVSIARSLRLPILIHTGEEDGCPAGTFEELFRRNSDITFILAHSRPIDQTIHIMHRCRNAYADTAFTPLKDILLLIHEGFEDRVLWGTDYPIPRYYYRDYPMKDYYMRLIMQLKKNLSDRQFLKITENNFALVFKS